MSSSTRSVRGQVWRNSGWVALLVVTVWTACFRFPIVWERMGIGEGDKPFLDLYGLLASCERAQAGFDPSAPNPLDPYHRPFIYPKWWLLMATAGLTRVDTGWLGVVSLALTLAAVLVVLAPRSPRETASTMAVLLSPAFLMGVHRANNDLVVFWIVSAALLLFRERSNVRGAFAVVLLAVAAVLKYYPLAGVAILLHARSRREFFAGALLFGLVLMVAWPALAEGMANAAKYKPRPEWLYAFGAPMLWRNFHLENSMLWLLPTVGVCGWATLRANLLRTDFPGVPSAPGSRDADHRREFLAGSVFVVGCFFLGASYVYKLVFAVWLLPGLWRGIVPEPFARFTQVTTWLLYAVLWFEGLGAIAVNLVVAPLFPSAASIALYGILTFQQVLTWLLIACLLRWILADAFARSRLWVPGKRPGSALPV